MLKPIKGEEWIEKFRAQEFWIGQRRSYRQKFYSRLTKSYVGWWLYFRTHTIWSRFALLIDPGSSGGLYSHVRCFLFNWLVVDLWWGAKHRIWKVFHKREWERECALMRACTQASEEGCADPMTGPEWLPAERFHGAILGERYFKRVAELLEKDSARSPQTGGPKSRTGRRHHSSRGK